MLPLTRKSDSQPAALQLWHTNFRNFEKLPDTKVVRTSFFINFAAMAVTIGLVLLMGYREYHIFSLGEQIAAAQKVIESNKRPNQEALRLSKIFADEQKKLDEAIAFNFAPISPSAYISLLARTLPTDVAIDAIDARLANPAASTFALKGTVTGTPDQASGITSTYVDTLRANREWAALFDSVTLTGLNRNARSGSLTFDISFVVKAKK
jgi:hypothetical protein